LTLILKKKIRKIISDGLLGQVMECVSGFQEEIRNGACLTEKKTYIKGGKKLNFHFLISEALQFIKLWIQSGIRKYLRFL